MKNKHKMLAKFSPSPIRYLADITEETPLPNQGMGVNVGYPNKSYYQHRKDISIFLTSHPPPFWFMTCFLYYVVLRYILCVLVEFGQNEEVSNTAQTIVP